MKIKKCITQYYYHLKYGFRYLGDDVVIGKNFTYANAKNIPFVVLAGENEIAAGKFTLKDMASGEQKLVTDDELVSIVKG